MSLMRASFAAVLILGLTACGPEAHDEPSDGSWILGRYLFCYGEFEGCGGGYLYELEFFDDGTLLSTQIACGYPKTPGPERQALWRPSSDEGVVELTAAEGNTGVKLDGGGVSEATAHRTDDCLRVDLKGISRRSGFPDAIEDYVLFRGDFVYNSEGGQLCQSTRPEYVQSGPPECPYDEP